MQDLPDDVPQQVTLAEGAAIATSSSAKRTWRQGGELRHHLVDPATGRSATGPWRSITVVAPTCLRANVATTAALVRGRRRASPGCAAPACRRAWSRTPAPWPRSTAGRASEVAA